MYTRVPHKLILDRRLSLRAKGLIGAIASYRDDLPGSMPPLVDGLDAAALISDAAAQWAEARA